MTAQLSRERLEEKLLEHIKHGGDSEEETMVRMLLSGMDSEPVAWIVHARQGDMLTSDGDFVANAEGISSIRSTPLYTAPPAPAPVAVPDELTREEYKRRFMEKYDFDDTYRGGWKACRAAMLKAGPVTAATVPDGWKLVPVEPTEAMLDAAYSHPASTEGRMRKQYASMLAAAPAAPEQEV